ncbi:Major Facilitator Superfamily protein [Saccharopolyspora antimicrobica]|uniref:MFS transporter n=1 Tax=Saccharopolyspora antimicrobica TaxID=455193 RepID=A0A1I4SE30_9PSEU|nr:MFS transporter [Saccharopolyspora antimicrobica]RKT87707.1 MFS transporter [Saccharopolyspora antimicrobica]SFM62739.1 Major Facilitator Superfamily protein [Saccharopolyspora antimicrobica]
MSTPLSTRTAPPRVGARFIILFALATLGIWMAINTPAMVTVALRVGEVDPVGKTTSYSVVSGVGTLVAVIANPLFGRLSDRTTSRFGMRRPWMITGILGTAVGAVVVGTSTGLAGVIIGWLLMQAFANAAIAGTFAVLGDQVPEEQQGLLGGLVGMTSGGSVVLGTFFVQLFPTEPLLQMGIPVAAALIFLLLFAVQLKDRRLDATQRPRFSAKEFAGSFWFNPRKAPDFAWFLLSLFLISVGIGVVSTYLVYFFQDRLHIATADLANAAFRANLVLMAVTTAVSFLAGYLSDRMDRRKPPFALAALLAAVGISVMVLGGSMLWAYVGIALVGVAYGSMSGVYLSFAMATLPDSDNIARDLGIVNIALTLPFSLVPFAAPAILAIGGGSNYTALFLVSGALSLLGWPVLSRIRKVR